MPLHIPMGKILSLSSNPTCEGKTFEGEAIITLILTVEIFKIITGPYPFLDSSALHYINRDLRLNNDFNLR